MGISGHILGERKLRRVIEGTGMPFDRAYRYHQYGSGRVVEGETCQHYQIDFSTWEVEKIERPTHWSSCPRRA